MKKLIFSVMLVIIFLAAICYADENTQIYNKCMNGYLFVVAEKVSTYGGISLVQVFERVNQKMTNGKYHEVLLPKECR